MSQQVTPGEDFGHEPIILSGELFCLRCRDRGFDDEGDPWSYPTLWPCGTAKILGLVPARHDTPLGEP